MTSRARWIILGCALLGLGFAGSSSWVHYRLLTDPSYISPCDINATFSCTQAYLSRYGAVWGGPVALGGVAWFALVALIAAFATPDRPRVTGASAAGSYVFGLATIGLAVILYLGFKSFFELQTYCLLCLGTYVSVIAIFVTSGLTTSVGMGRVPSRIVADLRSVLRKPAMLTATLIYIVAAASGVALFPREMTVAETPPPPPPKDKAEQFTEAWNAQPRVDLGIPAGDAKVLIVKFNDYLCPSCRSSALAHQPVLDQFAKTHPGEVKVVIRDWMWNKDCNFTLSATGPGHEASCDAAVAVRLARDRGKDRELTSWLWEHQATFFDQGRAGKVAEASAAIRKKTADLLGVTDFQAQYPTKLEEIRSDIVHGQTLQIRETPTFFINGIRVPTLPSEYLVLAIEIELKKANGKQ
jgi:uncharacterized membrane protein/protein-disulfide isomerase